MQPLRIIALLLIACQLLIRSLAAPHVHSAEHAHDVSHNALRRSHLHLSAFCHQDSHHHHHRHHHASTSTHRHPHPDEDNSAVNVDDCQPESEQHHRTMMVDEESLALAITAPQPVHPLATASLPGSLACVHDRHLSHHLGSGIRTAHDQSPVRSLPDLPLMLRI